MSKNISNIIMKNINEEFFGGAEFEKEENTSLDANGLFDKFAEMEGNIEDFADKWNNCTGYPDEVKRQRIRLINPVVVEFVGEYADDLKANWDEFYDIMEDNNYHTALFAIEKELGKYE